MSHSFDTGKSDLNRLIDRSIDCITQHTSEFPAEHHLDESDYDFGELFGVSFEKSVAEDDEEFMKNRG